MSADVQEDVAIDTIDMLCPLPVLKARKALRSMDAGQILYVSATDPGAIEDFRSFCNAQGHDLLRTNDQNSVLEFWIKKGG